MYKNWHVMRDIKGNYKYFYGDLSEYDSWDLEGYIEVQEEDYTSENILCLMDYIMTDVGYNTDYLGPINFLDILRSSTFLNHDEELNFIKNLRDKIFENIGVI